MPNRILRFLFFLLSIGLAFQPTFAAAPTSFTIVIDPGHGGQDPGTRGSSCREKDIVLAIGLKLGKLINERQPDVKVLFTRSTDVFIPLNQRAILANKAKANLFISIHADHAESPTVKGASTFTLGQNRTAENMAIAKRENSVILLESDYKQRYEGFDPNSAESYIMFEFMQDNYMNQSIQFASTLQEKFVAGGRNNRGVRQDVFLVLRCTSMPSVLVETGFLSNPEEEAFLKSEEGQQEIASCLYRGFASFRSDYDRKSSTNGALTSKPTIIESPSDSGVASTPIEINQIDKGILFKVQLIASNIKLSDKDRKLKGFQTEYYYEKGLYKYTIGNYSTFEEANRKRREMTASFPDAFVIAFKNGQKMDVNQAKDQINKK
jgi:N-acetylmuramoyl-L-alanine amidase